MDRNWKFTLGDKKGANETAFDDNSWRNVNLPHDWSIEGEFNKDAPTGGRGGYLPTGIGRYRKTFKLPAVAPGKQVNIQFDGIYQNSEVWINGHYLGQRPNGYISFVYGLTPYLKNGNNIIALKVDNSTQPNTRWYSGSGIYRHVWLNITNNLYVAPWGSNTTTPQANENSATLIVKTEIENKANNAVSNATLVADVLEENGQKVASEKTTFSLTPNTSSEVSLQLKVNTPVLWSVDRLHNSLHFMLTNLSLIK